jgi:membrane-associated HD superfamily phosphohydrolase
MDRAIQTYKPSISKKLLLVIAGITWFVSGCLLVSRAGDCILYYSHHILFHFLIGFVFGALSFLIIFFKISKKYTNSILSLDQAKPIIFSYANIRMYILLGIITAVVFFLKINTSINPITLSIGYVALGFAIIFSAVKFFISVITFKKAEG